MPIYLCKPGERYHQPWEVKADVYARPFPFPFPCPTAPSSAGEREDEDEGRVADLPVDRPSYSDETRPLGAGPGPTLLGPSDAASLRRVANRAERRGTSDPSRGRRSRRPAAAEAGDGGANPAMPPVLRRVRHSEVLLVDNVHVQYGRYWLRLRWPGPEGGFAGYMTPGAAPKHPPSVDVSSYAVGPPSDLATDLDLDQAEGASEVSFISQPGEADPKELSPTDGNPPSNVPFASSGLCYPTTDKMQLLVQYDDGVASDINLETPGGILGAAASSSNGELQPVFCRICREGIHDVLAEPAAEGTSSGRTNDESFRNHPTVGNPLLSPCECAGSMAFVHYLCVEQWRCRSRHPGAAGGLACETCGGTYALPPPPPRNVETGVHPGGERDWLDAMPPHVLAALRRPHPWWRVGAAVVRKPWLRPIAPVIVSPVVSLYCRARRMLKKRGVSRRRWACSLCRRRARWKCVRCLRSYYCSRQCQNVSWHIVHKHVCYKPVRFGWSVLVYSIGTLLTFPGIMKEPLIYGSGASLIPACFFAVGVLGGAFASLMKKAFKVDLRGRWLELLVVLTTIGMVYLSWGIVWGFFGYPHLCVNVLSVSSFPPPLVEPMSSTVPRSFLFGPIAKLLTVTDAFFARSGPASHICSSALVQNGRCFVGLSGVSSGFPINGAIGRGCEGDLAVLAPAWAAALSVVACDVLFRRRNRGRGGAAHAGRRGGPPVRPHID